MKKIVLCLLFLCCLTGLFAYTAPALNGRRIVDEEKLFGPEGTAQIEKAIRAYEAETGGQFIVAVLAPVEDASLEEVGIALMDAWKPGQKGKDDGIIFVFFPQIRKMRVEVGYGLEGVINDARAGDIIRSAGIFFKQSKYVEGVECAIQKAAEMQAKAGTAATAAVEKKTEKTVSKTGNTSKTASEDAEDSDEEKKGNAWIGLLVFVGFIALFIFIAKKGKAVPSNGPCCPKPEEKEEKEEKEEEEKFSGHGGQGGGGGASGGW